MYSYDRLTTEAEQAYKDIFLSLNTCRAYDEFPEDYWDVIVEDDEGIALPDGDVVRRAYVIITTKHKTMNARSSIETYLMMQHQLLEDNQSACFLIETRAEQSQNVMWRATVGGTKVFNSRIRRLSPDQFCALAAGEQRPVRNK